MPTIKFKYTLSKRVLSFTGLIILLETFIPSFSFGLTSGPSQPEFSSFEPVATTNMVSDFSGDLTYNLPVVNIPGANGGGYALSLSYHSGASIEEEASWVGYGWTLNPGSISRIKRGFPDDDNGVTNKYWNITPSNKTATVGVAAAVEGFSTDLPLNVNASLRYNNYKGFGYSAGAGMSFAKGVVSLGFNVSDGQGSFSVRVNPAGLLSGPAGKKTKPDYDNKTRHNMKDVDKKKADTDARKAAAKKSRDNKGAFDGAGALSLIGSNYGIFSMGANSRSLAATKYRGGSYNFTASVLAALTPLQVGPTFDVSGSYSWQQNVNSNNDPDSYDGVPVYGYMYSAEAPVDENTMMDYYTEKLNPYDKQDKRLGAPFSNADNFSVTGEGLGGGFRLYNNKAGTFHPNNISSNIHIFNVGAEIEAGLNIGGGADLGVGFQRLSVNNWDDSFVSGYSFADSASGDEPYFFRFTNDLGGSVEFGTNDDAQQANISGGGIPGVKSFQPLISNAGITTTMNSGDRSGRSSYIAYHTNREMLETSNSKYYRNYHLGDNSSYVTRTNISDGIGEFAIFNEEGMRYVYGLPVYSRKEQNINYDLFGVSNVQNNYLAYRDINSNIKSKVGEERDDPYATTYLITQITTPDFIDRTMDGPTDDDFGGYTRFSYTRVHGSNDKKDYSDTTWFKWRIPYTGLQYNKGERSNPKDDMGNISYGEKEIYYLDTIITKTHFAVFRMSDRRDGYASASNSVAANSSTAKGSRKLKKLDKIDIYSKNEGGTPKLIKSVVFEYDYSLCTGIPNGLDGTYGKLTLKRLWFEYEGVVSAKINPYVFEYTYPTTTYPTKYSTIDNYGSGKTENPGYSYFNIDPWGNYQANGANRYDSLKTMVNQVPPISFDPAAWQLKNIKLPSGGEIHIQYEQDDYMYVQDKLAHTLVSLKTTSDDLVTNRYYIKTADVGVSDASPTNPDLIALKKAIYDNYIATDKKMYFKFLYKLIGPGTPDKDACNADYVTGYCKVTNVGIHATNGLWVELGDGAGPVSLPRQVCWDYVKTQRMGNLLLSGNCDASTEGIPNSTNAQQIVEGLIGFIAAAVPGDGELCAGVNFPLSYLKIPVINGKKGGGLRVKRILMYDRGIESGDANLYGSEYSYVTEEGKSSGVATNEPTSIREENALVEFDAKFKQSFINRIVAGRDREQCETPVGESILPSPSIGYSRVLINNIHTGKTNTGFIVKEFYTAKDYPFISDFTPIKSKKDFLPLPGGLINIFISKEWMTQGFVFKLNNMHGQVKSETTYQGSPSDITNAAISSRQQITYFEPGEEVPMMGSLNSITWENPGKEMEVVFETRGTEDISHDLSMEFDADVGILFIPLPCFSMMPSYTYTENKLYSHVTTKVISYPAIQKKVETITDGIRHVSENVAFNPYTGKPILTRTYDGYDDLNLQQSANHSGKYYAYSFPATEDYPVIGPKAENERRIVKSMDLGVKIERTGSLPTYALKFTDVSGAGNICEQMGKLYSGDLIKLYDATTRANRGIFHVGDSITGNEMRIYSSVNYNTASPSIGSNGEVIVEVLKSGRSNQLNVTTGGFTTYGDTANITSNWDPNEITDREDIVDFLNSIYPSGTTQTLYSVNMPAGLYITSPLTGNCVKMKDSVTAISVSNLFGNLRFERSYQDSNRCVTNYEWGGRFGLDPHTKKLMYYAPGNMCHGIEVECLNFCPSQISTTQVIAATAQTFSDDWSYDENVYATVASSNSYENGKKGKWRALSSYVYKDTIIGANTGTQRNYKNAGVFELGLDLTDTTHWIKTSTVTSYSPDGNALEERDIFGIYTSAKFGYSGTQPYLIAKNASYNSAHFESFENLYSSTKFEDGWDPGSTFSRDNSYSHSGLYSIKMIGGGATDEIDMKPFAITQQMLDKGLSLKVWVKDTIASKTSTQIPVTGLLREAPSNDLNFTFSKIARVGEWILYEARITNLSSAFGLNDQVTPWINNSYSGKAIWLDDIRLQPLDASVITYVYDINTLRLVATFDDQHFGMFYQYNDEGKLVRKIVETEKGIKTITETQYHTPQQAR